MFATSEIKRKIKIPENWWSLANWKSHRYVWCFSFQTGLWKHQCLQLKATSCMFRRSVCGRWVKCSCCLLIGQGAARLRKPSACSTVLKPEAEELRDFLATHRDLVSQVASHPHCDNYHVLLFDVSQPAGTSFPNEADGSGYLHNDLEEYTYLSEHIVLLIPRQLCVINIWVRPPNSCFSLFSYREQVRADSLTWLWLPIVASYWLQPSRFTSNNTLWDCCWRSSVVVRCSLQPIY